MPGRRRVLRTLAGTCAALGTPFLNLGRYRLFADTERRYSARAVEHVRRTTVIDMLSPLTLDFDRFGRWMANPDLFTNADLAAYRDFGHRRLPRRHRHGRTGGPRPVAAVLRGLSTSAARTT